MSENRRIKAFHVNLEGIVELQVKNLKDMQEAVGGLIEVVWNLDNGDTVWGNEEGLLSTPKMWCRIKGREQLIAGSLLITGKADEEGYSTDAKSTGEELFEIIRVTENRRTLPIRTMGWGKS